MVLSWTASAGATSYDIYRSTTSNGEGSTAYKTGVTTTTFTNTGLTNGTTYYYEVTAVNSAGQSGKSSQVSAKPSALPSGWNDADIGSPGEAGSASYSNGTYTVSGGGTDVWGTSDQFNYAYQSVTGNATIIAEVNSQTNSSGWAKAGIMVRDSTAANGAYAYVFISPSNGVDFQYRTADGATAQWTGQLTGIVAPEYLKLVISGSTITAYASSDGVNWTEVGSVTMTLPSTVDVGLAVTAHNNAALSTATFSNVSVTAG